MDDRVEDAGHGIGARALELALAEQGVQLPDDIVEKAGPQIEDLLGLSRLQAAEGRVKLTRQRTMFDDPPTDEQGRITHYSIHKHGAVGRPHRVTCDGREIKHVRELDVCNGWVRALCIYDHTGYGGEKHLDPESPEQPCEVVFTGDVRFERLDKDTKD